MCSSASAIGIGAPSALPGPDEGADLELVVELPAGAEAGGPPPSADSVCPLGRVTGVPLTTIDEARP